MVEETIGCGPLLIRADAGAEIGAGHAMRCLALAEAWHKAGGKAAFLMAATTSFVSEKIRAEGFEVVHVRAPRGSPEDARETRKLCLDRQARWLVLDGYAFDADYHQQVSLPACGLMIVDDLGNAGYRAADIILNQNLHAGPSLYRQRKPQARLLLGPRYALIRREFIATRGTAREISALATRVLVTTGGGDPRNLLPTIVQAIAELTCPVEARVVVGGAVPHLKAVGGTCGSCVRIETGVHDLSGLMMWADIAISTAGSTCWELCCLGRPPVVIDIAENQRPIAQQLARRGIAVHVPFDHISAAGLAQALGTLIISPER